MAPTVILDFKQLAEGPFFGMLSLGGPLCRSFTRLGVPSKGIVQSMRNFYGTACRHGAAINCADNPSFSASDMPESGSATYRNNRGRLNMHFVVPGTSYEIEFFQCKRLKTRTTTLR